TTSQTVYAVKEFRPRRKDETARNYIKKVTAEFCISSALHHANVVETLDLVLQRNTRAASCSIMEYCGGGTLDAVLRAKPLSYSEIACLFAQLCRGVAFLHSMGVAHRDLKPSNLLLTDAGHLKIADFGTSDVFQLPFESKSHLSHGVSGSMPYIPPEEWTSESYDAREADVWACGIVYYSLHFTSLPWRAAIPERDAHYRAYVAHRFRHLPTPVVARMTAPSRAFLVRILEPDPKLRLTATQLLVDPLVADVVAC
ncbi:hypothetical protein CXG81DRAFT_1659, partial [Caulochytrium protostelioides]